MTSHIDVTSPGDCECQRRRHQQQRQELRHDDVSYGVTVPIYAEKIVAELIDTERTYVAELQQIVQVFYKSTCLSFSVCLSLCLSVASTALAPEPMEEEGQNSVGAHISSGVELGLWRGFIFYSRFLELVLLTGPADPVCCFAKSPLWKSLSLSLCAKQIDGHSGEHGKWTG